MTNKSTQTKKINEAIKSSDKLFSILDDLSFFGDSCPTPFLKAELDDAYEEYVKWAKHFHMFFPRFSGLVNLRCLEKPSAFMRLAVTADATRPATYIPVRVDNSYALDDYYDGEGSYVEDSDYDYDEDDDDYDEIDYDEDDSL
jgi:hypothetical protein